MTDDAFLVAAAIVAGMRWAKLDAEPREAVPDVKMVFDALKKHFEPLKIQ